MRWVETKFDGILIASATDWKEYTLERENRTVLKIKHNWKWLNIFWNGTSHVIIPGLDFFIPMFRYLPENKEKANIGAKDFSVKIKWDPKINNLSWSQQRQELLSLCGFS